MALWSEKDLRGPRTRMNDGPETVPVVILCGGKGTRFAEQTDRRPKPMIEVGGRPILWHIMGSYAAHGFKRFVLCLGYKSEVIKRYFLDYAALESDFTVDLMKPDEIKYHDVHADDWSVTCVDTGPESMTGSRLSKVGKYLGVGDFMLTYGDGLADVNLTSLLQFHRNHGRYATVTGVRPQSRFGELITNGSRVDRFSEKPTVEQGYVNGGFFVFKHEFLNYVSDNDSCILEREPLERAADDRELMVFPHHGFWQCMDTERDRRRLEEVWSGGNAPWTMRSI